MSRSYWDEATFDEGELIQVQEGGAGARAQPGPRVQMIPPGRGEVRPTQRATQQRQAPQVAREAPRSYSQEAFGGDQSPTPAPESLPEPSHRVTSRLTRQRRSVEDRTDPRYRDTPGFDWEETNVGTLSSFGAKMMAPGDEAYADIIKRQLGPDFVGMERDAHGQPLVRYRDTKGQEQLRYVNKPGVDMQDVQRGLIGAVPSIVGGFGMSTLQKGSGLLWNMLGQGATAGATSIGQQSASRLMGSNQTVDLVQAGVQSVAGAGGAALARPVGAVANRATARGIVDSGGTLTPRGAELAKQAGLDPDSLMSPQAARSFAETYALSRDATRAATAATNAEFGIPVTAGQVTKDPQKLLLEKNYKMGVHGQAAKDTMNEFYDEQGRKIYEAAAGRVAQTIAPARNVLGQEVAETTGMLGGGLRDSLKEARALAREGEKRAWSEVPDVRPTPEAMADLPGAIQGRLGKFRVQAERHPVATQMAQAIDDFMKGQAPSNSVPSVLGSALVATVDDLRKVLSNMRSGITDRADKAAASAIYKGFDDWQFSPATAQKLGMSVEDLAKQKTARDVTSGMRDLFEPRLDGKLTAAGTKLKSIMQGADSPEAILNTLLGAPGQKSAPPLGTVDAATKIRSIFTRAGDAGKEAWQDVGLAYWMRLVQSKRGTTPDYGVMLNNIDNAMASQRSLMRVLYTPEQLGMIQRFRHALSNVVAKDPNPSGTGTAIAFSMRQLSDTLIRALGWSGNGVAGLAVSGALSPLKNVAGGVGARRAIRGDAGGRVDPNIAPYITGAVSMPMRTDLGEF